jgi:hypothetical protein
MPRRIRQWWRAAIAAAAIMSPHAAAADQPLHAVQESEPQPPQPQTTTNGSPADAQTPAGTDAHDQADAPPGVPPPGRPERVFGVLPNYGTVEDGTTVSAITTKATFRIAALNAFDPYVFPFVGVIAALAQVDNQEKSLGRGPGAYVARYATSLADSSISSFLTSAIVPTLLKQDPRYFELHQGGVWHRAGYAASRTFITRSRSGETQFNLSGIGGNAVAAAVSNLYYPSADHSTTQTLTRWGTQVMWDAVSNELKEFWPDIRRKMHHD